MQVLPESYNIIWIISVLAAVALMIAAIIDIYRSRKQLEASVLTLWLVVVVIAPLLGAGLWAMLKHNYVQKTTTSANEAVSSS